MYQHEYVVALGETLNDQPHITSGIANTIYTTILYSLLTLVTTVELAEIAQMFQMAHIEDGSHYTNLDV